MFSEILKELREEKGVSQAELAKNLNVVQQTVAKWETDTAAPGVSVMKNIAIYFNVTTDYLLEMPARLEVSHPIEFPKEMRLHMEKYRSISSAGKAIVDATLDAVWHQEREKPKPNVEKREIS